MDDFQHYKIDYENGNIHIGEISIGSIASDPSWEWEFRTGNDYNEMLLNRTDGTHTDSEKKPVTWIVVAKDHYSDLVPHVTLLAEELIGKFCFDVRKKRHRFIFLSELCGEVMWSLSGDFDAKRGLRSWLNSTGIHSKEGFYQAFSGNFAKTVLTTHVPCRDIHGKKYTTQDKVFVPSTKELGDTLEGVVDPDEIARLSAGAMYKYFSDAENEDAFDYYAYHKTIPKRLAKLADNYWRYWTRSIGHCLLDVHSVTQNGVFNSDNPICGWCGVRPVLNIKAETLVSKIKH